MHRDELMSDYSERLTTRFRAGTDRVQQGFFQSLQIVMSGIGAYAFAHYVLGHHEPIFAATAAVVSLGYVRGATHYRRMLEVTIGCTLGIFIGDLLMLILGRGLWQAAIVLFLSIQVARLLDKGIIFTTQMGLQSCLVVLMVPTVDGIFSRSIDAIVGGLFAFLLMFFFPKDPRVAPRANLQALTEAFSEVLLESAQSIRHYKWDDAQATLERARGLQSLLDAAHGDIVTAKGMAKVSMLGRRYKEELEEYSETLSGIDLAVRNSRVFNRRMASTINNVQLSTAATDSIAEVLQRTSRAVQDLGESFTISDEKERKELRLRVRRQLTSVGSVLEPHLMSVHTLEAESLVLLLRPMVTDLLEATGLTHKEAAKLLIPLGTSMTKHAPRTNIITKVQPRPPQDKSVEHPHDDADQLKPDDTRALNVVLRTQQHKAVSED